MTNETSGPERPPFDNDLGVDYLVEADGISVDAARQRLYVQGHSSLVEETARARLGHRFGEIRMDDDGFVLLTIIDMTPEDVNAITLSAREAGIPDWVRTRKADPEALLAWEQVRHELLHLRATNPDALVGYPMPDPGYRHPPFQIELAAFAIDVAAALHQQFGKFVDLQVGGLSYPADPEAYASQGPTRTPRPTIDPAAIRAELDGRLEIRSGHTTTHGLNVTNFSDVELTVNTNGHLTADVIDPQSHRVVGGYTGMPILPLVCFRISPSATVRIPLLVGTASFDPHLGYAIPAGSWALGVTLNLSDGRSLDTPALPITITQ
jgi:hypothetical protein